MRYKIIAEVVGDLFVQEKMTFETRGYEFEFTPDNQGRLISIGISTQVSDDRIELFKSTIGPGQGQAVASVNIGGDKQTHGELVDQLQMIESSLDFSSMNALEKITEIPTIAEWTIIIVLWGIYIAHIFIHHKNKFNHLIFFMLVLMSFATTIIGFGSLIYYIFFEVNDSIVDTLVGENYGISSTSISGFPLYAGIAVIIFPFILALMISGSAHSPLYMYKAFIPYLLFSHVMVAWFGSYAYARIWDLSWGNRPADQLNDMTADQRDNITKKFKNHSSIVIFFLIVANICVFFIPFIGQIYLMAFFFTLALIQMGFSFIFLSYKLSEKFVFAYIKWRYTEPIDNESKIMDLNDIITEMEDMKITQLEV